MAGAIDIRTFQSNVNRMLAALPDKMRDIQRIVCLDAIPKIQNRLIDEGKTAEGKSTGKYSTRPLSPLMLIPQASGVGAQKRIQAEVKKNSKTGMPSGISYERFRQLNNLPTDHMTFSFTGDTLGDVGIIEQNAIGTKTQTVVASRNSKQKDIFDQKGKKIGTKGTGDVLAELDEKLDRSTGGQILELSKEEEAEIQQTFEAQLQNFIDNFL